ncbi:hypothetical protein [Sulfitobacter sp. AS59]|uniref:hypothetical protein n=1 Tax=Sulfitobacter sp. AS59 TaxID=3135784 RepID=UPI00317E0EBC
MEYLAVIGLSLDLVGVVVLGFDVLSLQKAARDSAESNRKSIEFHREGLALGVGWLEWRTGSVSEGLFESDGGIDADAAQNDFKALTDFARDLDDRVSTLVELIDETTITQESAASRSLKLTGFGLVLIVIGFGLQIAAQTI